MSKSTIEGNVTYHTFGAKEPFNGGITATNGASLLAITDEEIEDYKELMVEVVDNWYNMSDEGRENAFNVVANAFYMCAKRIEEEKWI